MAASGLLRERDLRALTAVVEDGLRDDPGEAMPWAVLDRLHQLIPADNVQMDEIDLQRHEILFQQVVQNGGERFIDRGNAEDIDATFWELRHNFMPCSYPARTGDLASVIKWSDFYTAAELKKAPFYASTWSPAPSSTR